MITNTIQLNASLEQLQKYESYFEEIRKYYENRNSSMFPIISEPYFKKIKELQILIFEYLKEKPVSAPLNIRIAGPLAKSGIIKASVVSKFLSGFQSAVYQIGGKTYSSMYEVYNKIDSKLRSLLSLNLIATKPGSFILSMDLEPGQIPLFEKDVAYKSISQLINYINEIKKSPDAYKGSISVLRSLSKVANIIKNEIEEIEIRFEVENEIEETKIDPVVKDRIKFLLGEPDKGEKTIKGVLIGINIENNTCKVHPFDGSPINCIYDEKIEDDLINAIKKEIEMAGEFEETSKLGQIKITKINKFRLLNDDLEIE